MSAHPIAWTAELDGSDGVGERGYARFGEARHAPCACPEDASRCFDGGCVFFFVNRALRKPGEVLALGLPDYGVFPMLVLPPRWAR